MNIKGKMLKYSLWACMNRSMWGSIDRW